MKTAWNDSEDRALQGLSVEAQIMYLRGIRRYMDYGCGIAGGKSRKINYQGLGEILMQCPDPGSTVRTKKPTRDFLRARLKELKRAGLVRDAGSNRDVGLVLHLPIADTAAARLKKEPHEHAPGEQHGKTTSENSEKQEDIDGGESGNTKANTTWSPTHPGTGLDCSDAHAREELNAFDEEGFCPSHLDEWVSWFNRLGIFRYHDIKSTATIPMLRQWCDLKLSTTFVSLAMDAAHARLGTIPDTPKYYSKFVWELLAETERLQQQEVKKHEHSKDTELGKPGTHQGGREYSSAESTVERASRIAEAYKASLGDAGDEGTSSYSMAEDG